MDTLLNTGPLRVGVTLKRFPTHDIPYTKYILYRRHNLPAGMGFPVALCVHKKALPRWYRAEH